MLKHRIQSGLVLGAALLAGLFFLPPILVLGVLLLIAAMAMLEFYALLDASRVPHFKIVGVLCGLILITGTWFALSSSIPKKEDIEAYILYAITGIIFFRQIMHKDDQRSWDTMAGTVLGIMYVPFLFNFFTKLLLGWGDLEGRFLLLYLAVVVKFTDIGAFFIGCAIGRHKLLPRVSPAKSWEGCIGGILTGCAASVIYRYIWHGRAGEFAVTLPDALILGLLLSVAGIVGDLIESLLKRAAGVKDSGTIVQGMGGVLDVIDSLLFAAPVLYVYARFFMS